MMLRSVALGVAILAGTIQHAGATAIIAGYGSSGLISAVVNVLPRTNQSVSGLTVTAAAVQASSYLLVEGNGTATVDLRGLRQSPQGNGGLYLDLGVYMATTATATGHAIAEARQIYNVSVYNSSDLTQDLVVRSHYSISKRVEVDDLKTESALAFWDVGVVFDEFELKKFGEFARTVDCSDPLPNAWTCPNYYDGNSSDYYHLALAPGESLDFEIRTVARFEVSAVPEPSTLALLTIAGLGALASRRRVSA